MKIKRKSFQVEFALVIVVDAINKYDAERVARELVRDGVVDYTLNEIVEQDPTIVVELDEEGNPK